MTTEIVRNIAPQGATNAAAQVDPGTLDLARRCKAALTDPVERMLTFEELVSLGAPRLQAILNRATSGVSGPFAGYNINDIASGAEDPGDLVRAASSLKTTIWSMSYEALCSLGLAKLAEIQGLADRAIVATRAIDGTAWALSRNNADPFADYDINQVAADALKTR